MNDDENNKKKKKCEEQEKDEFGQIGIGFDPSCGSIEPTINLGGGIGIGLDGHLTIGGF